MNKIQEYEWSQIPNFTQKEFTCSCGCGKADMDKDFIFSLQALRTKINKSLTVTSGYRCENHPIEKAKIKAGKSAGTHALGKAVDIFISGGLDAYRLVQIAIGGFSGIGVNRKNSFIHLDTATPQDGKKRPSLWNY